MRFDGKSKSTRLNLWKSDYNEGAEVGVVDSTDSGIILSFTLNDISIFKRSNGVNHKEWTINKTQ